MACQILPPKNFTIQTKIWKPLLYSLTTMLTKQQYHYVLELVVRDCPLNSKLKIIGSQKVGLISKLHALVLVTANQNRKVVSPLIGDSYSTKVSFFK